MFKKKTEKKSKERIKDKPNKEEVNKVLKRAEKKIKEDKLDLVLSTLKKYTKKVDKIENILSTKHTEEQKKQTKITSEKTTGKKLTNEEKLAQVQADQEKEKAAGQQPGQAPGQQTPEEKALGATAQFQQDIAQAQAAQTQAQEQGQQPQPGQVLTPQGLWLAERGLDAAKVIVPAMLQSKGNTGTPLKAFFEELKVYQGIENTVLSGFFNFMKMLPGSQREAAMTGIMTSPPVPTMTNLPPKSELIQ